MIRSARNDARRKSSIHSCTEAFCCLVSASQSSLTTEISPDNYRGCRRFLEPVAGTRGVRPRSWNLGEISRRRGNLNAPTARTAPAACSVLRRLISRSDLQGARPVYAAWRGTPASIVRIAIAETRPSRRRRQIGLDVADQEAASIHHGSRRRCGRLHLPHRTGSDGSGPCGRIIVCDPLLFCRRTGLVGDHLRATDASIPAFLTEPAAGWTNLARWQRVDDGCQAFDDSLRECARVALEMLAAAGHARRGDAKDFGWFCRSGKCQKLLGYGLRLGQIGHAGCVRSADAHAVDSRIFSARLRARTIERTGIGVRHHDLQSTSPEPGGRLALDGSSRGITI